MSRPPYLLNHYYHIYNRGAHKAYIFRERENYSFLIRKMKRYARSLHIAVIAYCLMPNHYHFLVRQDGDQRAGLFPQRIFNSYSKAYNKRYRHSGTLFESPYKVKLVDEESYILNLCRYIHLNPVKAGLVAQPEDWPYSNYLDCIGRRQGVLVDHGSIRDYFGSAAEYQAFVLDHDDPHRCSMTWEPTCD